MCTNTFLFVASIPSIPQEFALSTDVVFAKVYIIYCALLAMYIRAHCISIVLENYLEILLLFVCRNVQK